MEKKKKIDPMWSTPASTSLLETGWNEYFYGKLIFPREGNMPVTLYVATLFHIGKNVTAAQREVQVQYSIGKRSSWETAPNSANRHQPLAQVDQVCKFKTEEWELFSVILIQAFDGHIFGHIW